MNSSIDKIIRNLYEIIEALEEVRRVPTSKKPNEMSSILSAATIEKFLTVDQLVSKHPCFTKGGLRSYIFFEETNGLNKSGAIIRLGRKILIDEDKFLQWVENNS